MQVSILPNSLSEFFSVFKSRLELSCSGKVYEDLFSDLGFVSVDQYECVVKTTSKYKKEKIEMFYMDKILRALKSSSHDILSTKVESVEIIVDEILSSFTQTGNIIHLKNPNHDIFKTLTQISTKPDVAKYSFDNFVVERENSIAFSVAKEFASCMVNGVNNISLESNVKLLFITGSVGNGKTHLAQAIASAALSARKKVTYLTADKFVFTYVKSIRENSLVSFKGPILESDVFIVDDVHYIASKKGSLEEFYNIVNHFTSEGKFVILTSSFSLASINPVSEVVTKEKFSSVVGSGFTVNLTNPGFSLRDKIIRKKSASMMLSLSDPVLNYLSSNVCYSVRDIESVMNKININKAVLNTDLTVDSVKEILNDVMFCFRRDITAEDIISAICKEYSVEKSDLMSNKRLKGLAITRQIAMFLLKELTTKSYQEIASIFKKKSHSTIIHAISSIEKKKHDPEISRKISTVSSIVKDKVWN